MLYIDYSTLRKSLTGQITDMERTELKKWLDSSADNRAYYKRMKHFFRGAEKEITDVDANLRKFLRKTNYPLRRRAYLISSAAACVLLAFAITGGNKGDEREVIHRHDSGVILHVGKAESIALDPETHIDILTHPDFMVNQQGDMIDYRSFAEDRAQAETHTLETLRGSQYRLTLSDGTRVWLNAESKISYPAVFSGEERRVRISGELFFDIQPSEIPFILEAGGSEIRVLGTEFNVRSYDGEKVSRTTLISGKLEVAYDGQYVMLEPGEQAVMQHGGFIVKQEADITKSVAWKHGHIAFDDERLEDIMEQLKRWYDIDVEFDDQGLRDIRFTGDINQYDDINVLFRQFEKTRVVRFKASENLITVKKY